MVDISRRRITLVIASLEAGGAERVLSEMGNRWRGEGQAVTLITLWPAVLDFYPLHPLITRVALNVGAESTGAFAAVRNNLKRAFMLRRAIIASRPHVVISFAGTVNLLTLLAVSGLSIPVIVSERTDPTRWSAGFSWERIRRFLYPRAGSVVVQTERVAQWARRFVPVEKVRVIPNPVSPEVWTNSGAVGQGEVAALITRNTIVAMGRLGREKGFDLLVRAFALVRERYPYWNLVIIGEGTERENLVELAAQLRVDDSISFLGRLANPHPLVRRAGIFVLPSRIEGFPNVLLEAMALGLPVVAADCCSGPREIVKDGIDGLLCPPEDANALADAMCRVMSNPSLRVRLGRHAINVRQRFSVQAVSKQWEDLVRSVSVDHS